MKLMTKFASLNLRRKGTNQLVDRQLPASGHLDYIDAAYSVSWVGELSCGWNIKLIRISPFYFKQMGTILRQRYFFFIDICNMHRTCCRIMQASHWCTRVEEFNHDSYRGEQNFHNTDRSGLIAWETTSLSSGRRRCWFTEMLQWYPERLVQTKQKKEEPG